MKTVAFITLLLLSLAPFKPASAAEPAAFLTGVDTNYLLDLESKGTRYTDANGAPADPLKLLADAGCDSVRIRLWTGDEGMNGLKYATETAQRAQRAGLRPYVVIFLSENWADLVKQPVPAIWQHLDTPAKLAAIEAYSERVTRHLQDNGVAPDVFEIGNEIDFGLCGVFEEEWPKRVSIDYMRENIWAKMAPMIRAAQTGVRKVRPQAKFILHLAQWNNADYCIAFFRYMLANGVAVDLPGLSYFPTSAAEPKERPLSYIAGQIEKISTAVDRKLVLCEVAFPSAPKFEGQFADWNKPVEGYPLDVAGQAKWVADFMTMARANPHLAGTYYWSPEWCGAGMWEAFALFDAQGKAKPALLSFAPKPTPAVLPAATQPSTRPASSGKPLNIYFGNLHAHTGYSDGVGTPREAFAYARDTGKLDFIAITEHNHLLGGDKATPAARAKVYNGPDAESLVSAANAFNEDGRFVAIAGQEFSSMSKGNHVNVFDVADVIDVPNGSFDQLLKWMDAHRDGAGDRAVIQLNHPALGRPGKTIDRNEFGRDDFGDDAGWVRNMGTASSLIELLNGEPVGGATPARRSPQVMEHHYKLFLRLGFRLAPTGNQDNHLRNWGDATDTRTAILAESLTRRGLIDAMRARHVYATEDKNLKLLARLDGHLFGDATRAAAGRVGALEYQLEDADEPGAEYVFEVFSGVIGKELAAPMLSHKIRGNSPAGASVKIGDLPMSEPGRYYYLRVTQQSEQGTDRVWTAPVWLDAASPSPTGN